MAPCGLRSLNPSPARRASLSDLARKLVDARGEQRHLLGEGLDSLLLLVQFLAQRTRIGRFHPLDDERNVKLDWYTAAAVLASVSLEVLDDSLIISTENLKEACLEASNRIGLSRAR